ncbi:hypothetical protein ABHF33_13720 [Chitinibacter sp. FCG-7]|uniref:HEAT repeat domain-containing protein n=1 Tax=Chitinibacter mangrovi TaxID=3153927 RepID=A0AAU7F6G8_9NEIS
MTASKDQLYRPGESELSLWLQPEQDDWLLLQQYSASAPEVLARFTNHAAALAAQQQVLAARLADGFLQADTAIPAVHTETDSKSTTSPDPRRTSQQAELETHLIKDLHADAWRLLSARQRTRLVWRIGEVRAAAAVPRLIELLGSEKTKHGLLDYCIAWALGRCHDRGAMAALDELSRCATHPAAQRIARDAWLALANASERSQWAERQIADWALPLREAWQQQDIATLQARLSAPTEWDQALLRQPYGDWLEEFDRVSLSANWARPLLLQALSTLPLLGGTFRAARHIYKAAELRGDAAVWSLLQRRFEQTPAQFTRSHATQWVAFDNEWLRSNEELPRNNSRLAYSNRTRAYLVRRGWRYLRRLAVQGSAEFVPLAAAALLQYDDARTDLSGYTQHNASVFEQGRWQMQTRYCHPFSRSMLLNHLLLKASGSIHCGRNSELWWSATPWHGELTQQPVPFAAMWAERPDALLHLLLTSRAELVHAFAAPLLLSTDGEPTRPQQMYLQQLDEHYWARLLNSPMAVTAEAAMRWILPKVSSDNSQHWLALLLASRHPAVAQAGLTILEQNPQAATGSLATLSAVVLARTPEVRRFGRVLCQIAASQSALLTALLAQLLSELRLRDQHSFALAEICENLSWVLANPLIQTLTTDVYPEFLALLQHTAQPIVLLAAGALLHYPAQNCPATAYQRLLSSPEPEIQAAGVRLLAALPTDVLLTQSSMLLNFCLSDAAQVRQAAQQALQQIAPSLPANALAPLFDALFRAESSEGLHADLLTLLTATLAEFMHLRADQATMLRLLLARSRGAQAYGSWLLQQSQDHEVALSDWSRLARHEALAVRQRAMQVLDTNWPQIGVYGVLPVLLSRWPDTRQQALGWLRERVDPDAWSPESMIALCDNEYPEVRALGCDLLQQRLAQHRNQDCLLALAAHPSLQVQRFVASWLAQVLDAGESAAYDVQQESPQATYLQLAEYRHFLLTVLSQVNRGRAAKQALFKLLSALSLQSESLAQEVASLYQRLVLTVAIADKAQYIAALAKIRQHYPHIETGLQICPPTHRQSEHRQPVRGVA